MSRYLLGDRFARCDHCGGVAGAAARPLTAKQSAIYDYLADFIDNHGYAPSFNEIADAFGYTSLASVHEHLANLEAKGWIRRSYNMSRAIECLVPLARLDFRNALAELVASGDVVYSLAEPEPATSAEATTQSLASPPLEDKG